MEWIAAMQQAIEYMERHLLEEINYEDAARSVHISEYEFHRAFRFLTGMTANTYLRSRRLSLAARELVVTGAKITDIAMKYGYDTPESFTKAFTRFHGIAPRFARENEAKLVLFNPLAIKLTVEGGTRMNYRIAQTRKQRFLAVIRSFPNTIINTESNHDIPDFWDECRNAHQLEALLQLRPVGKQDLYGLCSPAEEGAETFEYGIGILIDNETTLPTPAEAEANGLVFWDVEPGTYAVFDCVGEDAACIGETWAQFYQAFLPQMGYEAASATDYEVYPENPEPGVFCTLWIPVRKK